MPVIALVSPSYPVEEMTEHGSSPGSRILLAELRRRGRIEGETIAIQRYSALGRVADFPALAQQVTAGNPDAIMVSTNPLARAFQRATTSIPIVANIGGDPVAGGFASSLARPGGNITGTSVDAGTQLNAKRLEVLHEAVPHLARVGFLGLRGGWERGEAPREEATRMGLEMVPALIGDPADEAEFRRIFSALVQQGAGGLLVSEVSQNMRNNNIIVELAQAERLAAIYPFRDYVDIGGLLAYGSDLVESYSHNADQLDKILKGTKPGDIPFTLFDQVPPDRQPQDREGAWPHDPADAARAGRRGD